MKIRLLSAVVLISALPVFAQAGPGGPMPHGPMGHGPMMPGGGFGMRQPVTNAPYSATFTSTSTEKLQDGTVLTHTTTRVVSRDSLGRTREEITMPARGTDNTPHTMVMIIDPVAHTATRLEADKKVAVVRQIPAPRQHGRRGPGGPGQPPSADEQAGASGQEEGSHGHGPRERKNVVVADLGSKTVSGVVATGKKVTHTIPAGTMGNSAPIVSTHEEWFAPDLKIELTRNDVDPFRGTRTTTVSGLTRAEPTATLFQVPPGYTVQQAPQRAGGRFGGPRRNGGAPQPSGV
jgi:hypothetical protein